MSLAKVYRDCLHIAIRLARTMSKTPRRQSERKHSTTRRCHNDKIAKSAQTHLRLQITLMLKTLRRDIEALSIWTSCLLSSSP